VILYAESSAVLAWLLEGPAADRVHDVLTTAERLIASDLTLIECDRVIIRAVSLGESTEADGVERRSRLSVAAARWEVLRISGAIVERARQPFPVEPVRSLDAIHLASALVARSKAPGLQLLSLDERIRSAARRLGFQLQPL
jgi:predicted nucleic acid-binding protein